MTLKYYICLIASFRFLTFTPCLSLCGNGFYGPNCANRCSANCRHGMCAVSLEVGLEVCTKGCKPGFYGSRCQVPCLNPSADTVCMKCPVECKDGFCYLGKRCVSGCVNDYYGYNCTHDRTEGSHPGCGKDCPECSFTVNSRIEIIFWVMLTFVSGVCVFVFLRVLVFAFSRAIQFMKKREQPAELGETLRLDGTGDNGESRTSGNESYIQAMPNHYDECNDE